MLYPLPHSSTNHTHRPDPAPKHAISGHRSRLKEQETSPE